MFRIGPWLSMKQHISKIAITTLEGYARFAVMPNHDPASDVSRDVPYRLLQFCARPIVGLPASTSLPFLQRVQNNSAAIGLFSALVGNPTSLLLYNNSTAYRSNSKSCLKLLRLCTTFSINVLRHILRTRYALRQWLPTRRQHTLVIHCRSAALLSVGQEHSSRDVFSRSAGRMFGIGTVSLLL